MMWKLLLAILVGVFAVLCGPMGIIGFVGIVIGGAFFCFVADVIQGFFDGRG